MTQESRTPASKVYFNLPTGIGFDFQTEDVNAIPLDGTNADLRSYSPFVIRLIPPAILADFVIREAPNDDQIGQQDRTIPVEEEAPPEPEIPPPGELSTQEKIEIVDAAITRIRGGRRPDPDIARGMVLASEEFGIPILTYMAVAYHESSFRPGAVSRSNAVGLYQIKPQYALPRPPGRQVIRDQAEMQRRTDALKDPVEASRLFSAFWLNLQRRTGRDQFETARRYYVPSDPTPGTARAISAERYPRTHMLRFRQSENAIRAVLAERGILDTFANFSEYGDGGGPEGPLLTSSDLPLGEVVDTEGRIPTALDYGNALNRFQTSDVFEDFTARLRAGIISSVTEPIVRELESFVSGGELYEPGLEGTRTTAAITDLRRAADILLQLIDLIRVPPILLLINPNSLQIQYTKIQNFSENTRGGFVHQSYGDDRPTMSISGNIGAFIAGSFAPEFDAESNLGRPSGLQFANKHNSLAFQQLMSILAFFKNSGNIFDSLDVGKIFQMVGGIAIDYDGWTYYGHFTSFTYGYDENSPNGGIEFSMEFNVARKFDYGSSGVVNPYRDPNNFQETRRRSDPPGSRLSSGQTFAEGLQTILLGEDQAGFSIGIQRQQDPDNEESASSSFDAFSAFRG